MIRVLASLGLGAVALFAIAGKDDAVVPTHRAAPGTTVFATGLRTGVDTPDGRRREVQIDRVRLAPGYIAGLRAPVLDGVALEGVRILDGPVVVQAFQNVDVGPRGMIVRRWPGAAAPPELVTLISRLKPPGMGTTRAAPR